MNLDELTVRNGFRERGQDMTRIETFTDAAFAIAASLMVISVSDVPTSWPQLVVALQGIPAFALALLVTMLFWYGHHIWSRRYGLDDLATIWLSGALILLVLVYVYPLKFMANSFTTWVSGGAVSAPSTLNSVDELYALFAVYAGGFMLMSLVIATLYVHAWRQRDALRLNEVERMHTRHDILAWSILAMIGLLSLLLAVLLTPRSMPWPGVALGGLAVVMPLFGTWPARTIQRMLARHGHQ